MGVEMRALLLQRRSFAVPVGLASLQNRSWAACVEAYTQISNQSARVHVNPALAPRLAAPVSAAVPL